MIWEGCEGKALCQSLCHMGVITRVGNTLNQSGECCLKKWKLEKYINFSISEELVILFNN